MRKTSKYLLLFFSGFFLGTFLLTRCEKQSQSESEQPALHFIEAEANAQNVSDSSLTANPADITSSRVNAITVAVEKASPAIVGITSVEWRESRYRDLILELFFRGGGYTQSERLESLGSGFIISPEGYIVTNDHVVQGADSVLVTLWGGARYVADIIGRDYVNDIALIKIDGENLPTCVLGNSDEVIRGEWAIALGNPFGLFDINAEPSVNVGVVSNVNMDFDDKNISGDNVYQDMIQTDAQINSGNSGGPLLNGMGEVIGMNTWILTARGGSANLGIGFAIPINHIKEVVKELEKKGKRDPNFWTGLEVDNVSSMVAYYLGLNTTRGVIITAVEKNSPGERAGLQEYDVILEINGVRINNVNKITELIRERDMRAGDLWEMKIYRRGRILETKLVLESPPK